MLEFMKHDIFEKAMTLVLRSAILDFMHAKNSKWDLETINRV